MFNHLVIGRGKKRACEDPDFIGRVLEDCGRKNYITKNASGIGSGDVYANTRKQCNRGNVACKSTQGALYSQDFLKQV